ncbi:class I SAM-dependent methyltransferase [Bacteriovoracaceae bacterium]|nr:class I SAM-dependent methyltransferase [Bacteriovoracaceae bacterium]
MGSNQIEWEKTYSSNTFRNKNQYPDIELVSFIMRTYGEVEEKSSINILELGCGWGNNLNFFKDKGFSYCGVDFSESAIAHCKKEHPNSQVMDFRSLSFSENSFDCIVDRMAVQHNPKEDIRKIINNVHSLLKSGGKFFSTLIEKANYDYETSFLSKEDILDMTNMFNNVQVDYLERSYNNGSIVAKHNILVCTK